MISYNWGSKETVLEIRDRLKSAGFKCWIDVENMSTYRHVRVNNESQTVTRDPLTHIKTDP